MKLTDYVTCKTLDIPADKVINITEGVEQTMERDYPYSDITTYEPDGELIWKYRVVESKRHILREMSEEGRMMNRGKDY